MNYSFAYPWLFLLLPLPLLLYRLVRPYEPERSAVRIPWFERIGRFSGAEAGRDDPVLKGGIGGQIMFMLIWVLLVAALARPQELKEPVHKVVPARDLLLLVDLSGSMAAEDFTNADGERVDRLTAVKEVLDRFLENREGDRVGLVVFGNAAFVQVPFTQDLMASRMLLNELAPRMAGPRTALGDAIGLGITLFERSDVENRVMIALTDGNDTGSRVPPQEAARIAADHDIVIHTVAVGDPTSVGEEKLDEEALRHLSDTTGGNYFYAGDRDELHEIYAVLDRMEARQVDTLSYRPRRDLFQWPLLAALLLSFVSYSKRAVSTLTTAEVEEVAEAP